MTHHHDRGPMSTLDSMTEGQSFCDHAPVADSERLKSRIRAFICRRPPSLPYPTPSSCPHLIETHRGLSQQVVESLAAFGMTPHRLHRCREALALKDASPTSVQHAQRHPDEHRRTPAPVPHEQIPYASDYGLGRD